MKTAITLVAIAAALTAGLWFAIEQFGPITPAREIGIALAIMGFLLWAIARIELGRSFSVRPKATELVTRGLYSKIRNPVYVFGTVFIVGMILWAGRPVWLLVLVIIVPMQIVRARKEAQVLEAKFGDAYRAYRSRTWF
jgi:protein-S-isoprenylcysteine O-methyltransferase Ste14